MPTWEASHCWGDVTLYGYLTALYVNVETLVYLVYSNWSKVKHIKSEVASWCHPLVEQEIRRAWERCSAGLWLCFQLIAAHCSLVRELCSCQPAKLKSFNKHHRLLIFSCQCIPLGNIHTLQCLLINLFSYTSLGFGLALKPQREDSSCQKVNIYNECKV